MKKLTSLLWLLLVLAGSCKHSDPILPDGTYLRALSLTVEPRPDGIVLAWAPIHYFEEYGPEKLITPTQYEIYTSETGEDALQKVAVIDGNIRQHIFQNQPIGKTFYAQVKAIHPQLTAGESNVVTTNAGRLGTSAVLFPVNTPSIIYGAWSNGTLVQADFNKTSVLGPDGSLRMLKSNGSRPVLSPDGRYVAFLGSGNNNTSYQTELFIETVATGAVRSVAVRRAIHAVEWSHDGNWLAFAANSPTSSELWKLSVIDAQTTLLATGNWNNAQDRIAWSPDDAFLVMPQDRNPPGIKRYITNLVRIPAAGGTAETLLASDWHDEQPAYSPDGQRLAFVSNRSGYGAIWVLTLKTGQLQQITGNQERIYYINRLDWRDNTQLTYSAYLPSPDNVSLKVVTLP